MSDLLASKVALNEHEKKLKKWNGTISNWACLIQGSYVYAIALSNPLFLKLSMNLDPLTFCFSFESLNSHQTPW